MPPRRVLLTSDSTGSSLQLIFLRQSQRRRNIFLRMIQVLIFFSLLSLSSLSHSLFFLLWIEFSLGNNEGDNHCGPMKKRTRTSWTNEEEIWLVEWISNHVQSPTYYKRINWQAALKEISSTNAKAIFAEDHLSSTKLMECAKRLAMKRRVTVNQLRPSVVSSSQLEN